MTELSGKVALVTGASRGIGLAIARTLAQNGATTVLNGSDATVVGGRADAIRADGHPAEALAFDVADEAAVDSGFASLLDRHGRLDILVNNAGIFRKRDIFDTSLADWNTVMATNLTGPFLCSRAALKPMRDQGSGRIIMISSVSGQRGSPSGVVSYGASKAGLMGLAQSLAPQTARFGVTVNVVAPGLIDTDMLQESLGPRRAEAVGRVPLGVGAPDDIAQAVLYLAGESGRYVNGATIDVNGGLHRR